MRDFGPPKAMQAPTGEGDDTDVEIVTLKPGQVDAGAAALIRSHADYPAFASVYPDQARRSRALAPFFAVTVRDAIPFGTVYAAMDGDVVLGIAIWLPPGAFPWSAARKFRATWAFAKVWAADPKGFKTFTQLGLNSEKKHPRDKHWTLEALGIRPEAQRRGLGTSLMNPILGRADSEGIYCYLETSDPANIA
ncbi:MAG: GNAT family N-acetyltransferase, partial [Actinomycetota bacterium]